jgi:hypothetical protein
MVVAPKLKGGLGIKDLIIQNEALLLKHLVKFYNKAHVPWVQLIWSTYYHNKVPHLTPYRGSFWWKDIVKLFDRMENFTSCLTSMGDTIGLWKDNFADIPFYQKFPNLFCFALNENLSLREAFQFEDVLNLFRLPMTRAAHNEFLVLEMSYGR